jgi:transposase
MGFFRKKKKKSSRAKGKAKSSESGVTRTPAPAERPQVPAEPAPELRVSAPGKSASPKARVVAPMEVKLLAIEAWEAGLTAREVAELADVSTATVSAWRKLHREGGVAALSRKPTSPGARRICLQLEERITAHRKAQPERGVRRILDDLRQEQAVEVSAETVRRVVNDAGLGNPAPRCKRRPPQIRRFERALSALQRPPRTGQPGHQAIRQCNAKRWPAPLSRRASRLRHPRPELRQAETHAQGQDR